MEIAPEVHGDLMVWWIPQIPCKAFCYPVSTTDEAIILLDALSRYDLFQLAEDIREDFSNSGGLLIAEHCHEGMEWVDWYDDDGNSIDDLAAERAMK